MTHLAQPPAAATLQFSDNTLLSLLLGDHDRHLVRIEQGLGVRLACRGNRIAITGEGSRVEAAQGALNSLYRRLQKGEPVGPSEVDAAIRMAEIEDPRLPLSDLPAIRTKRGAIGPRSPGQAAYMDMLTRHEMVFALGPAGTGKTYLAVAQAVAMLTSGKVDRIVLSRPAVEAGERLGFLPGDLKDKVDPYLRPLYDALHDMMDVEKAQALVERGVVEVAPLAFMRGRTLNDSFVILDEAQNATVEQMRMFLTRLGFGSKAVVTGDVTQVDLPGGTRSGLLDAVRLLENVDGIGTAFFTDADVVRHPLVARIVKAYELRDEHVAARAAEEREERERRERIRPNERSVGDRGGRARDRGRSEDPE